MNLQSKDKVIALKETDAYPAMPEDGYGWENFLVKECAIIFMKTMAWMLKLPDIIMFMVLMALMTEEEKKRPPLLLERLLPQN